MSEILVNVLVWTVMVILTWRIVALIIYEYLMKKRRQEYLMKKRREEDRWK